jgi:hypothetical protein
MRTRSLPLVLLLSASSFAQTPPRIDAVAFDGQRIWLEHGAVTEILDVSLDEIEQSFVVHRGARTGDLDALHAH